MHTIFHYVHIRGYYAINVYVITKSFANSVINELCSWFFHIHLSFDLFSLLDLWSGWVPCSSSAHRACGKKATVPF